MDQSLIPNHMLKQLSIYLGLYFTSKIAFLDFVLSAWFQLAKGESKFAH